MINKLLKYSLLIFFAVYPLVIFPQEVNSEHKPRKFQFGINSSISVNRNFLNKNDDYYLFWDGYTDYLKLEAPLGFKLSLCADFRLHKSLSLESSVFFTGFKTKYSYNDDINLNTTHEFIYQGIGFSEYINIMIKIKNNKYILSPGFTSIPNFKRKSKIESSFRGNFSDEVYEDSKYFINLRNGVLLERKYLRLYPYMEISYNLGTFISDYYDYFDFIDNYSSSVYIPLSLGQISFGVQIKSNFY